MDLTSHLTQRHLTTTFKKKNDDFVPVTNDRHANLMEERSSLAVIIAGRPTDKT